MHTDPGHVHKLTQSEILSLTRRSGQPTLELETFLANPTSKQVTADVCFKSACVLLQTIVVGLEKELLPPSYVPQIRDLAAQAIRDSNFSLTFWSSLFKQDQDNFHALNNLVLEKIAEHNDGSISSSNLLKIKEQTEGDLSYFKLRYVDLTSKQILALFIEANRPDQEISAVRNLLQLKDTPEDALISPRELGIAGHSLLFRADRRLNTHRRDSISCHQALQLIELGLNAFALLGTESNLPNANFGDAKVASTIKAWALREKIITPIESVGGKAVLEQDKIDFASLRKFYKTIFN